MGFTREELEAHRGRTVPDLIGERPPRLVFVGINPGLWTAATQTHFAYPGNRFYPALHLAGITARELDSVAGMPGDDRRHLLDRGIAVTNLCPRATARASELSADELRDGAAELRDRMRRWGPRVVAIAGITACRTAFGEPRASAGRQEVELGGAPVWVVPNPSGLNAHETVASLARWYRRPALEAGVPLDPPRWDGD